MKHLIHMTKGMKWNRITSASSILPSSPQFHNLWLAVACRLITIICSMDYKKSTEDYLKVMNLWQDPFNFNRACHLDGHCWGFPPSILVSYLGVKSQQLIWTLGTRRWNLWVPDLQMSCSDLTRMWGYQDRSPNNGCLVTFPIMLTQTSRPIREPFILSQACFNILKELDFLLWVVSKHCLYVAYQRNSFSFNHLSMMYIVLD